ncbi:cytosine deaminase [Thauera linaloolentis 47Lol = DSM 12138]|uniref:Cytosine deaminase n=1 Tax=Thauera linaloolentis (strain DSM 12138 / JCM 21573 / CCUG 41526 / CIP 105981 / IAM 15112 / NBRC 102519 / 47Lol) TaxID=1123367 RepID=N6Z631_THAL4|nr:cytosine deaminase [Thauera linaloolentis 47Lol = DSM 12138]
MRGHEILGLHCAQRHHVFVGASVAHHAHALHRQEHGEGLAGLVVPVGGAQFVDEDGVGAAQQVSVFLLDFAEDAHAQARPREGVAVHHVVRQAEGHAQFAHFVLEQVAQRLQQLQAQGFGQAADVVVALDGVRLLVLGAAGLDHVGVDGALRQPLCVRELPGFGLEDLDELAADDLALLFRIGDALQVAHELPGGVHMHDLGVQAAGEHFHDQLAFVEAQQAVVDEHAGELVTDGAVDQRRGHRRVDAARQAEDNFLVTDLRADAPHGFVDVVGHVPVVAAAADIVHETPDHLLALDRVRDLGVELHAVEAACLVRHRGDRGRVVAADELEARRQLGDLVAVAHPYVEQAVALGVGPVLDALEQLRVAACAHFRVAEFALAGAFDLAAELAGHGLHAVADAKHRHAELEHRLRCAPVLGFVHRIGTAGQDHALSTEAAHEFVRHVEGMKLAVHLLLAHTACNELGDLGAEVEDEDFLVCHGANVSGVGKRKSGLSAARGIANGKIS